jgi:hypothetical protein
MTRVTGVSAAADEPFYWSVSRIAQRLDCSTDKATRLLEQYRGQEGFLDLGSPEDVRKHKRRYSIIRVHPTLLQKIEAAL